MGYHRKKCLRLWLPLAIFVAFGFRRIKKFDLFGGADISRDSPCNAPIWNEMPQRFVAALFNRMEREGWPISSSFDGDRVVARDLNLRPEVFWRIVLENGGAASAMHSLKAVNLGVPNKNHLRIASLLKSGHCGIAITTNFDEYVERYLTEEIRVIVPTGSHRLDLPDGPIYLRAC